MEHSPGMILPFVMFEVVVFFTSVRAVYIASEWRGERLSNLARIAAWTAVTIVVSSTISGILAFNNLHEPVHYWIVGSAFLIAIHASTPAGIRTYARWLKEAMGSIVDNLPRWQALAVFSLAAPFLLTVIRPVDETDSLFNLQFMLDWVFNGRNPYWMNSHNPSFWELSYLPSIILAGGDHFFWAASLKTVLLIGTVNYMLGRRIGIPHNLCWPACLAGAMFFLLWHNPSGLDTIKTDMVFAAGVSLLAYGIVGTVRGSRRTGLVWWTLGAVFVLSKLSGVGVLLASVLILLVFARKTPMRPGLALYACIALLVVLGTSGHYYINSMAEYGNPFYPHSVSVFGVGFKSGTDKFSNTSIMSSIGDERLWGHLLKPSNIFAAGILYPAVVTSGVFGTSALILYNAFTYVRRRRLDGTSVSVSLFLLLTWLIFLFHYGGASHTPDDLVYVERLSSFRYVEGTFILTELFLVYILLRAGIRRALVYAVVGLNLASKTAYLGAISLNVGFGDGMIAELALQIEYLVTRSHGLDHFLPVIPVAAATILALLVYRSRSRLLKATALSAFIMAAFWMAPGVVDQNRDGWLPWYGGAVMETHYDEPATIYTVSGSGIGGGQKLWPLTYPWYGINFQHDVVAITLEDIITRLESGDSRPDRLVALCNLLPDAGACKSHPGRQPDHLVALCNPSNDCKSDFEGMESIFAGFGYHTNRLDGKSMLMTASPRSG